MKNIIWLCSLPNKRNRMRLGSLLGRFVFALGIRKKTVVQNLEIAFPKLDNAERIKIAKNCYSHFGKVIVDTFNVTKWNDAEFKDRVKLLGLEHLDKALLCGKGVIIATAHFGCFDVITPRLCIDGYKNITIYQRIHNPYVDEYIMKIRTMKGAQVAKRGIQIRLILKALKKNECVGFLADQDAGGSGLFIPFFSKTASTFRGLAELAIRTRAPIVPAFTPVIDGVYNAIFEEEIQIGSVEEIMTEYNRRVENIVKKFPEQYFWLHKKWKSVKK